MTCAHCLHSVATEEDRECERSHDVPSDLVNGHGNGPAGSTSNDTYHSRARRQQHRDYDRFHDLKHLEQEHQQPGHKAAHNTSGLVERIAQGMVERCTAEGANPDHRQQESRVHSVSPRKGSVGYEKHYEGCHGGHKQDTCLLRPGAGTRFEPKLTLADSSDPTEA